MRLTVGLLLLAIAISPTVFGCASGCGCGTETPEPTPAPADPFAPRSTGDAFGSRADVEPERVVRAVDSLPHRRRDPNDVNVVVYLEAEPDIGGAPLQVEFAVELDEPHPDATFDWDFGDGSTTSGPQRISHVYEEPGEYEAKVTVGIRGRRESETVDIDVEETSFDVSMDADPDLGAPPLSVLFEAEVVDDIEGPFTVEWDFGDGARGTGNPVVHVYRIPGDYIAKVVVKNSAGQRGTEEFEINVEEDD